MQGRSPARGKDDGIVSLIFPTYNPGPRLEATWSAVCDFLVQTPGQWEVLFVCDGCSDGSEQRLLDWARTAPRPIRVLSYQPNRGKGYAVRRGLLEATGDWRIFTDVDLAYGFDDITHVARVLREGAEVAIASRTHPQSLVTMPVGLQAYAYRRHLQSLVFAALARLFLPVRQRDLQAGLKGLSARATRLIVPHLRLDGFGLDCELLTACVRYGLDVTEVPVHVRYEDETSTTGFRAMRRMVSDLWTIRRTWRKAPPAVAEAQTPPEREAA